ncbi:glycoside hydrolase family 30 beta sandwich domain-containing protein [Labilibaculum sp.]|uniref:glycoside hydrolase family 30 protein n=1 Tax=Labilibaculum sp. TaxID=2060723 RepID=UPI0035676DCB
MNNKFCDVNIKLIMLLVLLAIGNITHAQKVDLVYTTSSARWVKGKKAVRLTKDKLAKADITVFADSTLQVIDGIGGAFNELGWTAVKELSDEAANEVFDALFSKEGCNFSMGRVPIGASDYALSYYSMDDVPEDFEMRDFNIDRDRFIMIPYLKEAFKRRPDFKLWGSPWTPPAWMKVNEHYSLRAGEMGEGRTGGNKMDPGKEIRTSSTAFKMQKRYLEAYALYFSKFVKAYKEAGTPVFMIQPQNEILYAPNWPACTWFTEDMSYFIGDFLGPKFEADSLDTEIWLGTINSPDPRYVQYALKHKSAKKYIKGVGFQWNGERSIPTISKEFPTIKLMQTENKCGEQENDWTSLERSWKSMVHYFNNGAGSYLYWNMILDETGKSSWGWPQNSMVVIDSESKKVTYNDEFYLFKHLSHFVQPGDHYLKSSAGENHLAFKLQNGSTILLVYNREDKAKTVNIKVGDIAITADLEAVSINTILLN